MCLGCLFDMIFIGVCTTRNWQTFGRLVQELNVCIVVTSDLGEVCDFWFSVCFWMFPFSSTITIAFSKFIISMQKIGKIRFPSIPIHVHTSDMFSSTAPVFTDLTSVSQKSQMSFV